MRIALNATCFDERASGAKQRFVGIYCALAQRMPKAEFVIFEPHDYSLRCFFNGYPNVQMIPTPLESSGRFRRFVKARLYWANLFKNQHFDIFEGFHLPLPRAPGTKSVFTLHDLRPFQVSSSFFDRTLFSLALKRAISHVDVLVTVSQSMKRELLPISGETPVHVIYNGINVSRMMASPSIAQVNEFRSKYNLYSGFILSVGHLEPRKNYPNLLLAIALLRRWGANYRLLIVGNDSGSRSHIESRIEALGLQDSVQIASGLSDVEVKCAYHLSELFVFPSFYEGFGIPILEAMATGCPLALSDIPVFREITQNQSAYFSSSDPTDIARVIDRLIRSPSEQSRQCRYGFQRVSQFSYSQIAESYFQLYNNLGLKCDSR